MFKINKKLIKISSAFLLTTIVGASVLVTTTSCANKKEDIFQNAETRNYDSTQFFPLVSQADFYKYITAKTVDSTGKETLTNQSLIVNKLNLPLKTEIVPDSIADNKETNEITFNVLKPNSQGIAEYPAKIIIDFNNNGSVEIPKLDILKNENGINYWAQEINTSIPPRTISASNYLTSAPNGGYLPVEEKIAVSHPAVLTTFNSLKNNKPEFKKNLETDLNYNLSNLVKSISNQWGTLTLLTKPLININIDINSTNQINGKVGFQILNNTDKQQTLNLFDKNIIVKPNDSFAFLIKFNNSEITPSISASPIDSENYLGYTFSNVSIDYQTTGSKIEQTTETTYQADRSIVLNTIVSNSSANSAFENYQTVYDENFQKTFGTDPAKTLEEKLSKQVYSEFNKWSKVVANFQPVLDVLAKNGTIGEFLKTSGTSVGYLVSTLTNNKDLGIIISNLLSDETISGFLYNSAPAIVSYLSTLKRTPIVDAILTMTDENIIGKTQSEVVSLVNSISSLKSMIKTMLDNSGAFNTEQTTFILNLLDEVAKDPNLFDFIASKMSLILNILGNPASGSVMFYVKNMIQGLVDLSVDPNNPNAQKNILNTKVLDVLAKPATPSSGTPVVFATPGTTPTPTPQPTGNKFIVNLVALLRKVLSPQLTNGILGKVFTLLENPPANFSPANLQSLFNSLANPVVKSNGVKVPGINTLADAINNAIQVIPENTNSVTYDPTTKEFDINLKYYLSFKYDINFPVTQQIKDLLGSVVGQLVPSVGSLVSMLFGQNIILKTNDGFQFGFSATDTKLISNFVGNQINWKVPGIGSTSFNLLNSVKSSLSVIGSGVAGPILEPFFDSVNNFYREIDLETPSVLKHSYNENTVSEVDGKIYEANFTNALNPTNDTKLREFLQSKTVYKPYKYERPEFDVDLTSAQLDGLRKYFLKSFNFPEAFQPSLSVIASTPVGKTPIMDSEATPAPQPTPPQTSPVVFATPGATNPPANTTPVVPNITYKLVFTFPLPVLQKVNNAFLLSNTLVYTLAWK